MSDPVDPIHANEETPDPDIATAADLDGADDDVPTGDEPGGSDSAGSDSPLRAEAADRSD